MMDDDVEVVMVPAEWVSGQHSSWWIPDLIMAFLSLFTFASSAMLLRAIFIAIRRGDKRNTRRGASSSPGGGRGNGGAGDTNTASFNVYLLLVIFPDCLLNCLTAISLFWEVPNDGTFNRHDPWGFIVCYVQTFGVYYYYFANFWMNAVIAYEVYTLIERSYHRRRSKPPSLSRVLTQGCIVNVAAILWAVWLILPVPWSPVTIEFGYCQPEFGSEQMSENVAPTMAAVSYFGPLIYVIWAAIRIWWRGLLPRSGRTRAISTYFFRILFVFVGCYIPSVVLGVIITSEDATIDGSYSTSRFWLVAGYTLLLSIQSLVTIRMALTKDDIRDAFWQQIAFLQKTDHHSSSPSMPAAVTQASLTGTPVVDPNVSGTSATSRTEPSTSVTSRTEPSHWSAEDVYDDEACPDDQRIPPNEEDEEVPANG